MTAIMTHSARSTAGTLAALAGVYIVIAYWLGVALLVAVAVALTCVCMALLAGIASEVFWGEGGGDK